MRRELLPRVFTLTCSGGAVVAQAVFFSVALSVAPCGTPSCWEVWDPVLPGLSSRRTMAASDRTVAVFFGQQRYEKKLNIGKDFQIFRFQLTFDF